MPVLANRKDQTTQFTKKKKEKQQYIKLAKRKGEQEKRPAKLARTVNTKTAKTRL
jgi:hypothetical protein